MNLLSAAERLAAIDRSAVSYQPERCLYKFDRFASCAACANACPTSAIQPGNPPQLDAENCARCLACLVSCPTGAFSADDSVAALLSCAARLESKKVEIICHQAQHPETGSVDDITALLVRGCLASLGVGTLVAIAALGFKLVIVSTTGCAGCEWGKVLHPHIKVQVKQSAFLLGLLGVDQQIQESEGVDASGPVQRPLWDVHNPPLSRRDLFMMATRQGQVALARAMNPEKSSGKSSGRDRQRMNTALKHFVSTASGGTLLSQDLGFAILRVDSRCTACSTCARACPTGALQFENQEDRSYRLLFSPSKCIACGACLNVCAGEALRIDHTPPFNLIQALDTPLILDEGEFTRCSRCKALIARRSERNLCPVCAFRVEHPFGSTLPPALLNKQAGKYKQVSQ